MKAIMISHPGRKSRSFNAYPAYKASGVEWLGEIPAHWEVMKVTWLFSVGSGTTPPSGEAAFYGGDIPWITTSELRESVITSTEKTVTEEALRDFSSLKVYPKDSIAVAMYGATIGRVGILGVSAVVNQACCVFSDPVRIDPLFWFYWLQMSRSHLISLGYGGGQPNLSQDLIRSLRVPTPPLSEQRAMVTFLDRETARIDTLVTKNERLIGLLREQRTAVITRAVTRGLDPNVPMKDSGIEWLGKIPAHWGVERLKWTVEFRGGGTPSKDRPEYWGGNIPWVSPKDMKVFKIIDTEDKITDQAVLESTTKIVPVGTVLLVIRSGILIHSIPVSITGCEVTLNQDMKGLIMRADLIPEYLMYLVVGLQKILLLAWKREGATVESLEVELIARTKIPLPGNGEQRVIVTYLGRETAKIDALIEKVRSAIDLLKEYRTALISAAVTGKIDVREEAA